MTRDKAWMTFKAEVGEDTVDHLNRLYDALDEKDKRIAELEERVKELEDMWEPMADAMLREISSNHGRVEYKDLHRQLGRIVGVIMTPRRDEENVLRMMHKIAYLEARCAEQDRDKALMLARFTGPPHRMLGNPELMTVAWRLYDIGVVAEFQAHIDAAVERLDRGHKEAHVIGWKRAYDYAIEALDILKLTPGKEGENDEHRLL